MMTENTSLRGADVNTHRLGCSPMVWRSVIAGTVAALAIQLILTLLGAGVGAALARPSGDSSSHYIGMSAVLWLVCSGIFSFGVGGFVAGVTSGRAHTGGGAVHGVLSWALASVLGAVLATVAGSTALSGAAMGVGSAAQGHYLSGTSMVGRDVGMSLTDAANHTVTLSDGTVLSETDARDAADRAAKFAARVSLWTGFAFLLSMGAAGEGGALGRKEHWAFFPMAMEAADRPVVALA